MGDIPNCDWLQKWTTLSKSFAFRYNPALQPRALIVFGCISKTVSDQEVKQLLRIMVKVRGNIVTYFRTFNSSFGTLLE